MVRMSIVDEARCGMRPGTTEILILLLIVLLLFGASRLPKLARSLREARDEFEKGESELEGRSEGPKSTGPSSESTPSADGSRTEDKRG
jgi:sec-independent protein translocase protein TatA